MSGDEGPGHVAGPRSKGLGATQMQAVRLALQDEAAPCLLGVPDAEEMAGARILEQALTLSGIAVEGDEMERVDMALVQPP